MADSGSSRTLEQLVLAGTDSRYPFHPRNCWVPSRKAENHHPAVDAKAKTKKRGKVTKIGPLAWVLGVLHVSGGPRTRWSHPGGLPGGGKCCSSKKDRSKVQQPEKRKLCGLRNNSGKVLEAEEDGSRKRRDSCLC